ncbi:MAG: hypothetical protein RLZZ08_143 [Pseudomonadota bacterium]|jgi:hypothetical protein
MPLFKKALAGRVMQTDIALRGVAIVLVVLNHASITDSRPIHLGGGLNILLLLSGYSFARFILVRETMAQVRRGIASFAFNLWLPCLAVVLASFALKREWSWGEVLFVSNFYTADHIALMYVWFPQVILQMLAIFWLLSFVPGARQGLARHPLPLALGGLAISFALLLVLRGDDRGADFANRTIEAVGWNFVLGCVAWYITHGPSRQGMAARLALLGCTAVLGLVAFGWGADWLRAVLLPLALALLLFVPRLRLPAIVAQIVQVLSQATFTVFLAHVLFLRIFDAAGLRGASSGFNLADTLFAAAFALTGSVAVWVLASALRRAWQATHADALRRQMQRGIA